MWFRFFDFHTEVVQMRFASASGDYNPMHMDALQARRTQAGAPILHGVHLLLWALDCFAESQPDLPPLSGPRAHFNKFVYLDEGVEVAITKQSSSSARLNISVDGASRSTVSITFGNAVESCPDWSAGSLEPQTLSPVPLNPSLEQMSGSSGSIAFQITPADAMAHFPAASGHLSITVGNVHSRTAGRIYGHLCKWILAVIAGAARTSARALRLLPVFGCRYGTNAGNDGVHHGQILKRS